MKWKKAVIILLTLAVALTIFTVPAVAADYNFWLEGNYIAIQGETYEVTLYGDISYSLFIGTVAVNFDSNVFEYVSSEWDNENIGTIKNVDDNAKQSGVLRVCFGDNVHAYSGAIVTLTFYVKETVEALVETSMWCSKDGDNDFFTAGFDRVDDSAIDFGNGLDIRIIDYSFRGLGYSEENIEIIGTDVYGQTGKSVLLLKNANAEGLYGGEYAFAYDEAPLYYFPARGMYAGIIDTVTASEAADRLSLWEESPQKLYSGVGEVNSGRTVPNSLDYMYAMRCFIRSDEYVEAEKMLAYDTTLNGRLEFIDVASILRVYMGFQNGFEIDN